MDNRNPRARRRRYGGPQLAPAPQRSAQQCRSSEREGFDAWRPPARVHPRQILKASDEAERSEAYHPLAWSGRLRVHAAAIVTLRSAASTRPARLLSKIHQRTFISKTNRRTPWRKNRSRRRATFCTSTIFA